MSTLEELDGPRLRDYLRDLLHDRGRASAEIDRYRQELPFHPIQFRFEAGSDELRERLGRGLAVLLREAVEAPWDLEPFNHLLVAVERARHPPLTTVLADLAYSGSLWGLRQGARRQMIVLRSLLGLGWHGHPSFWLEQHARFDGAYPALIFRALAAHDLTLAFDRFAELVANAGAVRQLLRIFPALIERHSLGRVRDLAGLACRRLPPGTSAEVQRWFEQRDYRPPDLERIGSSLDRYILELKHHNEWIGFLERVGEVPRLKGDAIAGLELPLGPGSELEAKSRFKKLSEEAIAAWVQRATAVREHWGRQSGSQSEFQETLIRAIRSYDPARGELVTYLWTVFSEQNAGARREVLSPNQLAYLAARGAGYSDRKIARIVKKDHKTVKNELVTAFGAMSRDFRLAPRARRASLNGS